MGFNYGKNKEHGGQDSMWTSYSDLFLGLSIIFLLLYVSASLKQGTDGIRQHLENQRLVKEAEDLRQQIKVYETLKQDYLKKQASQEEQANYEELMGQLNLLQDQAGEEKNKLRLQAQENEKKERALNKYQQMIRNIINSNMIAKSRIKSRDTLIDSKDEIITEKSQEITSLEQNVREKTAAVQRNESQLTAMKEKLDQRMKQLRSAYKAHKITKSKYEQQQQALKRESDGKIASLQAESDKVKRELSSASQELKKTSTKLSQVEGELASETSRHHSEVEKLKGEFDAQKAKDRAAFDAQLAREKLSGDQRAAREAQYKADAEKKARDLAGKIADLDQKYKQSQGALAKANENLNARKNLAAQIKKNFEKYGVKADVDTGTGDVLLSFGDQYFDTGRAELKPRMAKILEQAVPAYSASLFENDKVAEKIQSVEIVGFASPTYKGKFVDPASLDPENRQAVNYNLDLSYNRARSIFNYVFDRNKMAFKHQQRLLPLVKVTGRSFLASDKVRQPAASGTESFCRVNDCAKLQKVIIKFNLKD